MNNLPNTYGFNPNAAKWGAYQGLGAGVGSLLGSLLGNYQNPMTEAMPVYNQYMSQAQNTLNPYVNQGTNAMQTYQTHLNNLLENPTSMQDTIAQHYSASPYNQYLNHMAAADLRDQAVGEGYQNSPEMARQIAEMTKRINSQDLQNYVNTGLNQYNTGLGGQGYLTNLGYNASNKLADLLQNQGSQNAAMRAASAQANNEASGGIFSALGNLFGASLPLLFF